MDVDERILAAHANNFVHRSCWSSFQGASLSLFNRAMIDSSLCIAVGVFYSIVSERFYMSVRSKLPPEASRMYRMTT